MVRLVSPYGDNKFIKRPKQILIKHKEVEKLINSFSQVSVLRYEDPPPWENCEKPFDKFVKHELPVQ